MTKKIVFLSGTRADFGKIKSLLKVCSEIDFVDYSVFVTGMHMLKKYGSTFKEVENFTTQTYKFINQVEGESMEAILANTIDGFSKYVHEYQPTLIIVHGDRVEALAGAIVGSINNILVAHIEGGERSGTIDELIRHSVTKMSHIHLVSNKEAKDRVMQMGESQDSVFVLGSPDIDVMCSDLPNIAIVKERYLIEYESFHIVLFHPVTTEIEYFEKYATMLVDALLENANENYIVIYPNNDMGSDLILRQYARLNGLKNFKIFPSIRFEYFLSLMKNAVSVIGNSSAGIREAPFFNIPSINIGTRQNGRGAAKSIIDVDYNKDEIKQAIKSVRQIDKECFHTENHHFGNGDSAHKFKEILESDQLWNISRQKYFIDRK